MLTEWRLIQYTKHNLSSRHESVGKYLRQYNGHTKSGATLPNRRSHRMDQPQPMFLATINSVHCNFFQLCSTVMYKRPALSTTYRI